MKYLIAALIIIATTSATAQQPVLTARYDSTEFLQLLPHTAPKGLKDFRGLAIEEGIGISKYPLVTTIFFDASIAELPDRYILFTNPTQTLHFDETKIPGGALQKHGHILNVIGSRLREYPDKFISIVGCNSRERKLGETREVSQQRAQNVYNYLVTIWGIDPARITMLQPRDLPKQESNPNDAMGDEENRRVEIITNDWEMEKIIVQKEARYYPTPWIMKFHMNNGIDDSLVARREIVITRDGKAWHVMNEIGTTTSSVVYNWGKDGDEDSIPRDEVPYVARLIVHSVDGRKLISESVEVPVKFVELRRRSRGIVEKDIWRYTILLFPFDDSSLEPISRRALQEYIYPTLRKGSQVYVTGYTDVIGSEDHNQRLSERRADAVKRDARKHAKKNLLASLGSKGVGETTALYSNDLPEGRFYNRTVQVVIENPATEW